MADLELHEDDDVDVLKMDTTPDMGGGEGSKMEEDPELVAEAEGVVLLGGCVILFQNICFRNVS